MQNIFIGMLLVFLNFNLDIDSIRIGLIPTFLGYIFIARGLSELNSNGTNVPLLRGFSNRFVKVLPYVKGMILYSGICYAMDLLGFSSITGMPISYALGIISTIVSLFISYNIIMGIKDIETMRRQNLNSGQLYSAWKLLALFSFLVYLVYIIPVLGLTCIIANLVTAIYYLYLFYKTKNLFYANNVRY